jgi:hypothetical protein
VDGSSINGYSSLYYGGGGGGGSNIYGDTIGTSGGNGAPGLVVIQILQSGVML